jgi:hypothetical protein
MLWSKNFNKIFQNSKRMPKTTFKSILTSKNFPLGTGFVLSENSNQQLFSFSEIFNEEDEDEGR